MAKKIIILEQVNAPSDSDWHAVFWADVPAARQVFYANPTATSQYSGATTAELAAIQSGAIAEKYLTVHMLSGQTLAQTKAELITEFNQFQTDITNANPWTRFGSYWDGTTWTSAGVA
jgi:hypothetical protein